MFKIVSMMRPSKRRSNPRNNTINRRSGRPRSGQVVLWFDHSLIENKNHNNNYEKNYEKYKENFVVLIPNKKNNKKK